MGIQHLAINFLNMHFWWLVLTITVVLSGLTLYSYKYRHEIPVRQKRLLTGIRTMIIVLLVISLLRPVLSTTFRQKQHNQIVILFDDSASMSLPIRHGGISRRDTALTVLTEKIIPNLSKKFNLIGYRFGKNINVFSPNENTFKKLRAHSNDESETDIAAVIRRVVSQSGYQPVAGVILLSDGRHTTTGNPVAEARALDAQGIPIMVYDFGSPEINNDIAIADLIVPTEMPLGQTSELSARLYQRGYTGKNITLTWHSGNRHIGTSTIMLKDRTQRIRFQYKPTTEGTVRISAEIKPQPGELTDINNKQTVFTRIVKNKFKVLFLYGTPDWDYTFMRRLLMNDKNLITTAIAVTTANEKTRLQKIDPAGFDLVIIGNLSADMLGTALAERLKIYVGSRGRALLLLGGAKSFQSGGYHTGPLREVIPIRWKNGGLYHNPFTLHLTGLGRTHPVMRLNDDAAVNQKIWENLPPLDSVNSITETKPGTEVLAVHSARNDLIVCAAGRYGSGKVGIFAGSSTWRWYFLSIGLGRSGEYYGQFWRQFIRYLVTSRLEQINLHTDRYRYNRSEQVHIVASLFSAGFEPVTGAHPIVSVQRREADGWKEAASIPLKSSSVNPEQYSGVYSTQQDGEYRVHLRIAHPRVNGSKTTPFLVQYPTGEFSHPDIDFDRLTALARATGGILFNDTQAEKINDQLTPKIRKIDMRYDYEFFNTWLFYSIIIILLTAEWIWRKKHGLL